MEKDGHKQQYKLKYKEKKNQHSNEIAFLTPTLLVR